MGSLAVHVVDRDQRVVFGKRVVCHFAGFTRSQSSSDREGVARFNDVPVGRVEIYVQGEHQVTVDVGMNDYKDVTVTV